ncbi:hypothetical protein Pfo_029325 [Paulownia fortunei]|nr:hypothetical protein Pfo_029325 [Paulownia fortunei]
MPERDVKSATALIGHFAKHNQHREAILCFLRMLLLDIRPNEYTFGTVVHSSVFYAKCGSMEDSLLAFNKMRERNIVTWNAVICGHAQNGQGNAAIEMYQKMKLTGIQPNSITLLGLLLACNHDGLIDEGPGLLKAEHYACMIDLLSRSGRFQEAERFIHDLPFVPGVGFWKALLGGCQLDPRDVSSYVMLSNAHSAAGRWENVLTIRQMMREKGLSRIPGSSWIEIKSKVHVFVTGDKRHSNRDEIYMALGFSLNM